MMSFVRFLQSSLLWADLPEGAQMGGDCPFQILVDLCHAKGQGASYWEVDPTKHEDLSRVVAAYIATQSALGGLSLVYASTEEIRNLGVRLKKSAASSPDKDLGSRAHYDMTVTSVDQALKLAQLVRASVRDLPIASVKSSLFASIKAGHIKVEDLQDKIAASLIKNKHWPLPP